MKLSSLLLALILSAGLAACGSSPTATPTLMPYVDIHVEHGKTFDMRIGNSALLFAGGQAYRLDFVEVVADSRCPTDAECLRPDAAILGFTLAASGTGAAPSVHQLFFDSGPSKGAVGPFTVQIMEIAPRVEAVSGPNDYVVTLLAGPTATPGSLDVEASVSGTTILEGEKITVSANVTGAQRLHYTLTANGVLVGLLNSEGDLVRSSQAPVFELRDWQMGLGEASWVVTMLNKGEFAFETSVTGVTGGSDGTELVAVAGSDIFSVTVQ